MYTKPSQSEESNEVLVHSSKFQLSTPTIQSIHMQKCHNLSGIHKHCLCSQFLTAFCHALTKYILLALTVKVLYFQPQPVLLPTLTISTLPPENSVGNNL